MKEVMDQAAKEPLPEPIREVFDEIVEKARENFTRDNYLQPVAIMVDEDKEILVLGLEMPESQKGRDFIGDTLRNEARKRSVTAILFMSEVWTVNQPDFRKAIEALKGASQEEVEKALNMDFEASNLDEEKTRILYKVLTEKIQEYLSNLEGTDDEKKQNNLTSNFMMSVREAFSMVYGSMELMPGSAEMIHISAETIWGNWWRHIDINRENKNADPSLGEDSGWRKLPDSMQVTGRFADLLAKTPTTEDL